MTNKPTKSGSFLVDVQGNLLNLLESKKDALPNDFNKTRFLQNCMTVLMDIKDIDSVDPLSVSRTMLKGAFLGLDFFNKECYAIPYNKKDGANWVKDIQFQTDYKGEKKLAKKYSINPIKDIYAKLVRKNDVFEESIKDGQQVINFKPLPFNNEPIIGAFAVALFHDGTMMYEAMSKLEIESVKMNYSKTDKAGKYSKAWDKSPGEMYKKTVYRRLCKNIELSFDSIEQAKAWDDSSDMDMDKPVEKQKAIAMSSLDNVIEIEKEQNHENN